ncbi:MAG: 4Fe-4S dicluster domain-containing protein [Myxococcaceae bacterium]
MRNSQIKWLYAQLYFAWVGFIHYVEKFWPWTKRQPGIEAFQENYFTEGYLPCSADLRAIAHEPGRCTTCGLCDAACPESLSPMRMLLKPKSTIGDLTPNPSPATGEGKFCLSCRACETACPEKIPIISYVQLASKTFHPGASWRQITST